MPDTAAMPELWSVENRARGQCDVELEAPVVEDPHELGGLAARAARLAARFRARRLA